MCRCHCEHESLHQSVSRVGITINSVLMTAFTASAVVLYELSKSTNNQMALMLLNANIKIYKVTI